MKILAGILISLYLGLTLFGLYQYKAHNRSWGMKLVVWMSGLVLLVGIGKQFDSVWLPMFVGGSALILILTHAIGKALLLRPPTRSALTAGAICLVCTLVAVWAWMRFSYCWDFRRVPYSRLLNHGSGYEGKWPTFAYGLVEENGKAVQGRIWVTDETEDVHPKYVMSVNEDAGRLYPVSVAGLAVWVASLLYLGVRLAQWRRSWRDTPAEEAINT